MVGDADRNSENTRVAAVTGQRSVTTQLEDLLLQRLVTETQSRPPPVMSRPAPTELEQMMRSFLSEQRQRQRPSQRQRPARRDWSDVVCFSCGKSGPELERLISVYAAGMAGREDVGWVYYDPALGGNGPPAGGKRRLIREERLASRVSSHVRPRDPGGGGGQRRLFPHDG